jgi:hypothetical protein
MNDDDHTMKKIHAETAIDIPVGIKVLDDAGFPIGRVTSFDPAKLRSGGRVVAHIWDAKAIEKLMGPKQTFSISCGQPLDAPEVGE